MPRSTIGMVTVMRVNKVKYTLDRIEEGQYVFLKHPDEENQLLVPSYEVTGEISEGDIVLISRLESGYEIEALIEESEDMKEKVSNLLEKLKNKKVIIKQLQLKMRSGCFYLFTYGAYKVVQQSVLCIDFAELIHFLIKLKRLVE